MDGGSTVEPYNLLKSLSSHLGYSGEIRGPSEAAEISKRMKETEAKLPLQMTFIKILRATTSNSTLEKFYEEGGWDVLLDWLQQGKDNMVESLLINLLQLYLTLPVTLSLMKKNETPKTIKSLIKDKNLSEEVRKLAKEVKDKWLEIITISAEGAKKARKDGKENPSTPKNGQKMDAEEGFEGKSEKESSKQRTTVKQFGSKMRSLGFDQEEGPLRLGKKKSELAKPDIKLASSVANLKVAKNERVEPVLGEKRPVNPEDSKSKVPSAVSESSLFVQAMFSENNPPPKKRPRRNMLPGSNGTRLDRVDSVDSDTGVSTPAPPSMYTDTLEEGSNDGNDSQNGTTKAEKGLLNIGGSTSLSSKKKRVSWAAEPALESIKYFVPDESERVRRTSEMSGDISKIERLRERENIQLMRTRDMEDWPDLIPIELPPSSLEPGSKSEEKLIQEERCRSILQVIYFTRNMIPDSPGEPDEDSSIADNAEPPKKISLGEDEEYYMSLFNRPSAPPEPQAFARLNISPDQISEVAIEKVKQILESNAWMATGPTPLMNPGMMRPISEGLLGNYPQGFPFGMGPPMGPNPMFPSGGMGMVRMFPPSGPPQAQAPAPGPRRWPKPVVCKHFVAPGGCRYGNDCQFLHPGVNGPPSLS